MARDGDGDRRREAFRARVAAADAFVHVQDMAGQDVLDADAFAEHEGGFAAAAAALGGKPALYHVDTSAAGVTGGAHAARRRSRASLRAAPTNPRWIAGQMRHGHRGAAEIAETVDNLFALAATAGVVPSRPVRPAVRRDLRRRRRARASCSTPTPTAAAAIARSFDEALAARAVDDAAQLRRRPHRTDDAGGAA